MSTAKTMEEKVYDLMDWAAIEAVVYGEESRPDTILGAHIVPEGVLIQAFFPGAGSVSLKIHDKILPMICEDEAGYFAILLEGKKIPSYTYLVDDGDRMGSRFAGGYPDPYNFGSCFSEKELIRFRSGIWNKAYTRLGARLVERDGISGVQFAVWAPNAVRVSVVGDFNAWNGLSCQMVKNEAGIFELFLPGLTAGVLYKYEIKTKRGDVYLKADPFAHANEAKIEGASIVADMENYTWGDAAWLDSHREAQPEAPAVVYEVHLNSWRKKEDGSFLSYAEIAPLLTAYVRDMGYTHVELLPVMEYPDPASLGYGTQSFFAPTARLGKPEELKLLIDTLHQAGIGVILDWVPGFFARGKEGLSAFDGTCLYEHLNPKQGVHPMWNTLIFNYGRGEVRSFMSSSAFYWLEEFHADGLRINDVASMVYLDYGRAEGDWIANIYGGNENLETIAFLKELNAEVARQHPGAWMIAEEETGYPEVTGDPAKNGLGFTYKWNNGCLDDYIRYIELDPLFRGAHQDDLTFSMIYMYSERFFLSLSHDRMYKNRRTLLRQMPGGKDSTKLANLRLTLAYLMTYPGKKLIFMGQDFAQREDWDPEGALAWEELDISWHSQAQELCRDLIRIYKETPALYAMDEHPEGFEWISNLDRTRSMLVYLRKTEQKDETILVVANFSNVNYPKLEIGVPFAGRYKEIFNSDSLRYGGGGVVNPRVKLSRPKEADERKNSITINVPALGVSMFRCTPDPEEAAEIRTEEKKPEKTSRTDKPLKKEKTDRKAKTAPGKKAKTDKPLIQPEELLQKADGIRKMAADRVQQAADAISGAAKPITDAVGGKAQQAADAISEAAKPITDAVGGKAQQAADAISGAAKPITDAVGGKAQQAADAISEAAKPITDAVGGKVQQAAEAVTSAADKAAGKKKTENSRRNK